MDEKPRQDSQVQLANILYHVPTNAIMAEVSSDLYPEAIVDVNARQDSQAQLVKTLYHVPTNAIMAEVSLDTSPAAVV